MADAFEFTIPTPTIALKADRSGHAVIDVTSRLDRHGSVRVEVLPGAQADASWFGQLEPEEFQLPAGETLRTKVPISVPTSVEAGSYDFTFRASAVDDPQVDFTESPVLGMSVPEPAEPGGIPTWVFILIGALVVAVFGLVAYFLFRPDPEPAFPGAPNLIGLPISEVPGALAEEQTLRIYSEQSDTSGSCVLLQSPPPDSSTISVSVLAVPCPRPGPEVEAPEVLTDLCANVTVNGFCRDVESFFGVAYAENPDWEDATGEMIQDFREAFTVDGVVVESVVGRTENAARDAVAGQGLAVDVIADGSGGSQCVYLQHPFVQRAVADGSTISLITTRCPAPADSADSVVLSTPIAEDWSNLCGVAPQFCSSIEANEPSADYFSSDDFDIEMSSMVSTFLNTFTGDVVPSVVGNTLGAARTALEEKGLEAVYAFPALESSPQSGTDFTVQRLRCFNVVGQNPDGGTLIANLSTTSVGLQLEEYPCTFIPVFPIDIGEISRVDLGD